MPAPDVRKPLFVSEDLSRFFRTRQFRECLGSLGGTEPSVANGPTAHAQKAHLQDKAELEG
jgi:hypothetical protein